MSPQQPPANGKLRSPQPPPHPLCSCCSCSSSFSYSTCFSRYFSCFLSWPEAFSQQPTEQNPCKQLNAGADSQEIQSGDQEQIYISGKFYPLLFWAVYTSVYNVFLVHKTSPNIREANMWGLGGNFFRKSSIKVQDYICYCLFHSRETRYWVTT